MEHVKHEATQTYFCQLRTNTTACTWPANDYSNGVRDHSNNNARHAPKSLLGENKHPTRTMRFGTNACHSLVSSVDTSTFTTNFTWRSSTTGGTSVFSPFFVSKMCGTPSLHAIKCVVDKKHVVFYRESLCGPTRTYLLQSIMLAQEYKWCRFVRCCIMPPRGLGDAATRNASVWIFLGQQF